MYKLIQMFHAFVMFAIIQYIYVLFQWYIIIILLFPQVCDASVECNPIYPCAHATMTFKVPKALPQTKNDILIQIINIIIVPRIMIRLFCNSISINSLLSFIVLGICPVSRQNNHLVTKRNIKNCIFMTLQISFLNRITFLQRKNKFAI